MSALLIRRRRPIGEPATGGRDGGGRRHSRDVTILAGTAGAARLCAALLELGVELTDVRQAVIHPDAAIDALAAIALDELFDPVVLGSHLVNTPDEDQRAAFITLAARHLGPTGALFVEHHPLDWAATAAPTTPDPGADVGMAAVRRDPPFVSAVSTFGVRGRTLRVPFRARVLSDAELAAALLPVGLEVHRRLGPTWIEARARTRTGLGSVRSSPGGA